MVAISVKENSCNLNENLNYIELLFNSFVTHYEYRVSEKYLLEEFGVFYVIKQ